VPAEAALSSEINKIGLMEFQKKHLLDLETRDTCLRGEITDSRDLLFRIISAYFCGKVLFWIPMSE
jgi:hypothetical protein